MLGLEPQRRNKAKDKNKITKPKSKPRKSDILEYNKREDKDTSAKMEWNSASAMATPSPATTIRGLGIGMGSEAVKHESQHSQPKYKAQFLPTTEALSEPGHQNHHNYHHTLSPSFDHTAFPNHTYTPHSHRLMTPSSETDGLNSISSTLVVPQRKQTCLQVGAGSPDSLLSTVGFESGATEPPPSSWGSSGTQGCSTNFDAAFYPPPSSGSTHDGSPDDLLLGPGGSTAIKVEEWTAHFHSI